MQSVREVALNLRIENNTGFKICVHCSHSEATALIERVYQSIRNIQLFIMLFNVVNRHVIFTLKLLYIGMGITSGYAAIAHFSDYPIFGMMYYVMLIDVSLIYTLVYQKGFMVSYEFQTAKKMLKFRVTRNGRTFQRKILEKQLMSIPTVGITVGDFHMLERTSTPIFLHYVLTNIVNMLVAFG